MATDLRSFVFHGRTQSSGMDLKVSRIWRWLFCRVFYPLYCFEFSLTHFSNDYLQIESGEGQVDGERPSLRMSAMSRASSLLAVDGYRVRPNFLYSLLASVFRSPISVIPD